jgi:hypothetical protein
MSVKHVTPASRGMQPTTTLRYPKCDVASFAGRRRRDSLVVWNSADTFLHFTRCIINPSTVNKITAKVVGQHVLNLAQCFQEVRRRESIDPLILKLGKRWMCVISFTLRPLYLLERHILLLLPCCQCLRTYSVIWCGDSWMQNWKGFGRKWSWLNKGITQTCAETE